MTAADGNFAALRYTAAAKFKPCADRESIRRIMCLYFCPMAGILCFILLDFHRRATVHDHDVEPPVAVQVGKRGAA